ncbi:MAG: ShlB/FhaC/HecB family hemolysin secretion/activation protein [Rhizomicrobium sp.]
MKRPLKSFAVGAAFAVAVSSPSWAQDFQQVAPKQIPAQKPGTVQVPPAPAVPAGAADTTLLPALKGIRLVNSVQQIARTGAQGVGLQVTGLPLLDEPEIRKKLWFFIGKPLAKSDLARISKIIVDWYRAHHLPVVDVTYPEQDLSTGILQAVVSEYRVGKIKVEGNRWFDGPMLADEMTLRHGDRIDFDWLGSDLNGLNRNPFRQVNVLLEKGDDVGYTDIALQVQDQFPLRVYASYDNQGLPVTGRERYSAGFNWGNVFGLDQQFSYQFTTSPDLWRRRDRGPGLSNAPRFAAHSATYFIPLPWGDGIDLFGSYVKQVPNLGPDFGQQGDSVQLSGRYDVRLPSPNGLAQGIKIGFDFKRSNNNLAFGGVEVFGSATEIDQFLLIYDATRPDKHGQTALENTFVYSPGGFGPSNRTAVFRQSGVNGASAQYVYDNLEVTRVTNLRWNISWVVRATGQVSGGELLPSEQLGAGGVDSVRGYDERSVSGSQGVLLSTELRSPAFHPLGNFANLGVDEQAQVLAFWDYGDVAYKHVQQNLPKSAELQSVGFGARYGIGSYLDARFDYGWQLERVPGAARLGNLATVSVTLSY